MKRVICFILFTLMLMPAISIPGFAAPVNKTLDIHGAKVPYHINDRGILEIELTDEILEQIMQSFDSGLKADQKRIEIDLSGFENLAGFALRASSWTSVNVESSEDVRLYISPHAAMLIEDNSSGGEVLLEAAYSFTGEKQVKGLSLSLTQESGYAIETVGAVSFPAGGYGLDLQNIALARDGEVIAKSCVLDGLFYAAVSLSGEYEVIAAQPVEFKDEIPSWAKGAVDWMSARGVIKGGEGLFRPNDGITRAEFMTMFARLYNTKSSEISPYYKFKDMSDVPEWALWSLPGLLFDAEHDGFLYPNKVMTCAEVMKAVQGYIAFFDLFFDEDPNEPLPFTDADAEAVPQGTDAYILSRKGLFSAGGGKADMDETATRAQAAELLCRFAKWETFNRSYR